VHLVGPSHIYVSRCTVQRMQSSSPTAPAGYSSTNAFGPRDVTENIRETFLVIRENIKLLDSARGAGDRNVWRQRELARGTGQKCVATEGVGRNCDHPGSRIYRLPPLVCTGFLRTASFRIIKKKAHEN
jgi:hypothetical protein